MMEEHRIAMIASIAHEANRAYCSALGDASQPRWVAAPQWQQDSAIAGVQAHLASDLTPEQSHEAWLAHKQADGWVYGPVKDPLAKQHPCCVPYDALPEEQRVKDRLFRNIVAAFKGAWEMTRRPYIKPPRSEDCVWRDGPPPGIGWWPASSVRNLNPIALRWWDGEWSCVAYDSDSPKFAGLVASMRTGHADRDIRWTDRWWEDGK